MAYTAWVSTCIGALSACIPYLHGGLYANLKIIFVTFFGGVGLIIIFWTGGGILNIFCYITIHLYSF